MHVCMLSHVPLYGTLWTTYSLPGSWSMGFSWQECWSRLQFPPGTYVYNHCKYDIYEYRWIWDYCILVAQISHLSKGCHDFLKCWSILIKFQAKQYRFPSIYMVVASLGKNKCILTCLLMQQMLETRVRSLGQEEPLEELQIWETNPVFLPGDSHGQRSSGHGP